MELKGTTAVITGSTGRLGSAITLALARAGCNCFCHYNTNQTKAQKLAEDINKLGLNATAHQADLASPEQIESLFEKVTEFGNPQILINSAAIFTQQPLAEVTFEQTQKTFQLNAIAPILTSSAFAKIINEKFPDTEPPVAKIINLVDIGGIRPWPRSVAYCSSKAALIATTKALAKELAPAITVNAVAPGLVTWPENFDDAKKQRQLSFIPAKRIAKPEEIADTVLFLLRNDYIIGQVINVDGGRCI